MARRGVPASLFARLLCSPGRQSNTNVFHQPVTDLAQSTSATSHSLQTSSYRTSTLLSFNNVGTGTCSQPQPETSRRWHGAWNAQAQSPFFASITTRNFRTSLHALSEVHPSETPSLEKPRFGRYQDRELVLKTLKGEECGRVTLPGTVFDVPIRKDIVHSVVRWQLAKRRSGTHSTLTVGEVRGTSKKPWNQKGSGRARQGSRRGPHFRGGATMHGPKPRSYDYPLPKKVRRLGLRIALSSRLAEGKLAVYRHLEPDTHKTKDMAKLLASAFPGSKKLLLVDQVKEKAARKAASGTPKRASVETASAAAKPPADGENAGSQDTATAVVGGETGTKAGVPPPAKEYWPLTKEQILALKEEEKQRQRPLQKVSEKLLQATSNLHYVNVLPTLGLNVYSILQHDMLVMSLSALQGTIQRLQPKFLSRREKRHLASQAARAKSSRQRLDAEVAA